MLERASSDPVPDLKLDRVCQFCNGDAVCTWFKVSAHGLSGLRISDPAGFVVDPAGLGVKNPAGFAIIGAAGHNFDPAGLEVNGPSGSGFNSPWFMDSSIMVGNSQ